MVRTVFLEPLERLDGLVVGEADPGFAAGEPVDFIGEGKLAAEFERAGEGIVFEARDAEEPPPMMRDQFNLLRFGFGLRTPFGGEARQECVLSARAA